jgi:hypothetical protein
MGVSPLERNSDSKEREIRKGPRMSQTSAAPFEAFGDPRQRRSFRRLHHFRQAPTPSDKSSGQKECQESSPRRRPEFSCGGAGECLPILDLRVKLDLDRVPNRAPVIMDGAGRSSASLRARWPGFEKAGRRKEQV